MTTPRLILKSLAIALAVAFGAASCNTMHGMGEDIQTTGGAIKDASH